jgi:selenocysteine-specific elongation factor
MIIGTAGHIDHGKTTLVRMLTGVNTDRLKEEQRRGISIELGYAYTRLPDGTVLGFIDVPGHERLVHTMVAGACGIDFALLVIAADDGIMPQTREHLAILELLGVSRAAVALTKVDRVGEQQLRRVQAQVSEQLGATVFAHAPLFLLNATAPADPGTRLLNAHLQAAARQHAAQTASATDELFRLAIDRVFTLAGRGVVVTGTAFAGRVEVGDTLAVMPAGLTARVRSLHVQNEAAPGGARGDRCALNLSGVEKSAIRRGDWLADPRALAPTTRVDVRLQLLREGARALETWTAVHFHAGSAHRVARVVPLDGSHIAGGESARVQLSFESAVCAIPGDRFIVRDAQALHTIGGGVVLDPLAPARKRRSPERLAYLGALERMLAGEGLGPVVQQARYGTSLDELARLSGKRPEALALPESARVIDARLERFVILEEHWAALRQRTLAALRAFHAQTPDEAGPDGARLRRMAVPQLAERRWRALLDELLEEAAIARSGQWLRLPEHVAVLSSADQTLAHRLQPLLAAGGFDPPWVRELAATLGTAEDHVRQVLLKQVTRGAVYQLVRDLFYDATRMSELVAVAATVAGPDKVLTAAEFRDAIGLGRKRTIQILEFFDRVGYTRRVRDTHLLRTDSAWGSVAAAVRAPQSSSCAPGAS